MITIDYCATMARYNRWQNRSLTTAADGLDDAARKADRGAFFGSIAATFSHVLWGDLMWMGRLAGDAVPGGGIMESVTMFAGWDRFKVERAATDARILAWARSLRPVDLAGDLAWVSSSALRELVRPRALCVTHFFNHQTHHRGQIHAMLTAAGMRPEATDLVFLPQTD